LRLNLHSEETLLFRFLCKKIAVDVVSIGEVEENQTKLEDFVKAVDKDSNR